MLVPVERKDWVDVFIDVNSVSCCKYVTARKEIWLKCRSCYIGDDGTFSMWYNYHHMIIQEKILTGFI